MPDNWDGKDSRSGMADKYSLGRHMLGDRSTAGADSAHKAQAAKADASQAETPELSSSRALLGNTSGNTTGSAAAFSARSVASSLQISATSRASTSHPTATASLAKSSDKSGTTSATNRHNFDMLTSDTAAANVTVDAGLCTGRIADMAVLRAEIRLSGGTGSGNGERRNEQRNPEKQDELHGEVAAIAPTPSNSSGTISADPLQTPSMQNVSTAILRQMETMRTSECRNSLRLNVELPEGGSVEISLRWRGSNVTARFGKGSEGLEDEIEDGWASLTRSARNEGLDLEPPHFEKQAAEGDAEETPNTYA
jgi:hypothetical protein